MGFIRAYNSAGDKYTILLRSDTIVTIFVRYRDGNNRNNPDQQRRSGHTVEVTIDTSYDGPVYALAICEHRETAESLRDELATALTDGTFGDGGVFVLDTIDGLQVETDADWADDGE